MLLITVVAATGRWQELIATDLPAAAAFGNALGSPLLGKLVLIEALLRLFTSWNGGRLRGADHLGQQPRRRAGGQAFRPNTAVGAQSTRRTRPSCGRRSRCICVVVSA